MSYKTDYVLEVQGIDQHMFDAIDKVLAEINGDMEPADPYPTDADFHWNGPGLSWYDHEGDMVKLSQQFPDILFILSGNGENAGDLWKAYFLGGLFQRAPAQIVYDDFDKDKLRRADGEEENTCGV